MADEEILRRLDLIQATLQIAFKGELDHVREALRQDKVSAALLDLSEDWIGTTELQKKAAKQAGTSTRTVLRRINELVADRVLAQRGTARSAEYRRTGLV